MFLFVMIRNLKKIFVNFWNSSTSHSTARVEQLVLTEDIRNMGMFIRKEMINFFSQTNEKKE